MNRIYILIFAFVLFALYKERQALGCRDIPDGSDCNNAEGKAIKGTKPLSTDSTSVVYQKIRKAADFSDRWVMWRIGILISFVCIIFITFFLRNSFPDPKELMVGMFVITAIVYFTMNFYKFHLINYARDNIDEGIRILSSR
jgi:RsiW-degrading membrane proteinase PrsW (M82 family)